MLLLAHRGFHAGNPENSMAAFDAAVAIGVDGIETDVRLSADGKPVIVHDRISPGGHAIATLTHRELGLELGHPVPLLAEILEAFPEVLWNIEIKTPEVWTAAFEVLRQFQGRRHLLVTSFRHEVVMRCAAQLEIECALLLAHRPLDVGAIIAGCAGHPHIRGVVWDYNIVDDAVLEGVACAGWKNYVYGASTVAEHMRCAGLGLAGLITDYPLHVLARVADNDEG